MTEKITRQYLNFTEAIRFNNLIESEKEIENIFLKDPQTVLKFQTTITKKKPQSPSKNLQNKSLPQQSK